MILGLLRDLLIQHFTTPLNAEEPDLRHLVWRADERTGILIESVGRWRGELLGKRPAVVIKPNARHNVRIGIQDDKGDDAQGHRHFQTFWVGSHTLFCIHGSLAAADILATEVQRQVGQWHPVFVDLLGLYRWQVTEIGEPAEVEEARENVVFPVTVGWTYTEQWKLSLESLKLRKIQLSALLDGVPIQGEL